MLGRPPQAGTDYGRPQLPTVALLVVVLLAMGMTIWWAKTTVATAEASLWVERGNVKALQGYAETVNKALDQKRQEAESLREECERLKAQPRQKQ